MGEAVVADILTTPIPDQIRLRLIFLLAMFLRPFKASNRGEDIVAEAMAAQVIMIEEVMVVAVKGGATAEGDSGVGITTEVEATEDKWPIYLTVPVREAHTMISTTANIMVVVGATETVIMGRGVVAVVMAKEVMGTTKDKARRAIRTVIRPVLRLLPAIGKLVLFKRRDLSF